jgi:hypothetical protein
MEGKSSVRAAVDGLCTACISAMDVDGAAVSVVVNGESRGTLGSSGELSRRLEELQFTLGEGPGLDAVRDDCRIGAGDLASPEETRWPAFGDAALNEGVRAVFGFPVGLASATFGTLDLYRHEPGLLSRGDLHTGQCAAVLAAQPIVDLVNADGDHESTRGDHQRSTELTSVQRLEVYQATGMIMEALAVDAIQALIRLRAYAFLQGRTASEIASAITERRLAPEVLSERSVGESDDD